MDNFIAEIKNYILFLKKQCQLEITLHPNGNEQLISESELIYFNIHENSHCIYVKTFPKAHEHCINRQYKINEKCKTGSFCGTCYAGVTEYVYPINGRNSTVGFICVSGYRNSSYPSYVERCSEKFGIPFEVLYQTAESLKEDMPDKEYIDMLIAPLIRMLELAYVKTTEVSRESDIVDRIIKYVNRYYSQNITLCGICEDFFVSRSSVSHIFNKKTGQSFREYLVSVRLNAAKSLLCHSRLSITEIAFSVGFSDSNYFSNVFKAKEGITPGKYRKLNS